MKNNNSGVRYGNTAGKNTAQSIINAIRGSKPEQKEDSIKNKILYLTIEISQLLRQYNCTYCEAKEILELIASEINQQQEELEYETVDDYLNQNKTYCADNDIIRQLNHSDGY